MPLASPDPNGVAPRFPLRALEEPSREPVNNSGLPILTSQHSTVPRVSSALRTRRTWGGSGSFSVGVGGALGGVCAVAPSAAGHCSTHRFGGWGGWPGPQTPQWTRPQRSGFEGVAEFEECPLLLTRGNTCDDVSRKTPHHVGLIRRQAKPLDDIANDARKRVAVVEAERCQSMALPTQQSVLGREEFPGVWPEPRADLGRG